MPLNTKPVFYLHEGNTFTEDMIRNANPNTSFPSPFVPPEGYEPVYHAGYPEFDPMTQYLMEIEPTCVGGVWQQTYQVLNMPEDRVAAMQLDSDRMFNSNIKRQIAEIEAGQQRALREAALGQPERLVEVEASIQALRDTLKRDADGNVI